MGVDLFSSTESECFSSGALISTHVVSWWSFHSVSVFTVGESGSNATSRGLQSSFAVPVADSPTWTSALSPPNMFPKNPVQADLFLAFGGEGAFFSFFSATGSGAGALDRSTEVSLSALSCKGSASSVLIEGAPSSTSVITRSCYSVLTGTTPSTAGVLVCSSFDSLINAFAVFTITAERKLLGSV